MLRHTLLALAMLFFASHHLASWQHHAAVVGNLPSELVGKWVVMGGNQDGATFDFSRDGVLDARINLQGREGIIKARVKADGKALFLTTQNPNTNQDDTKKLVIKILTEKQLVFEDKEGSQFKLTRIEQEVDPLPSWNDVKIKKSILEFVAAVTAKGGPDFVPVEDRIATFDNDGTLWCEQPLIQGMFCLERFKELLPKNPAWKDKEPFKAIIEKDKKYLEHMGEEDLIAFFLATQANITKDAFQADAAKFFATAKHKKFGVLYQELTYKPMVELVRFLQANQFQVFICSGGDVDFMRLVSKEIYNIPVENVIGTSLVYEVQDREGKLVLFRTAKIQSFCDKIDKPKNIWLHIGKRPIFAAGNVRSGGDIAMLRFSQAGKGKSLQLMVNHDDAEREFAYAENDHASLNASMKYGFHVVSMKNDWKKVFAFEK